MWSPLDCIWVQNRRSNNSVRPNWIHLVAEQELRLGSAVSPTQTGGTHDDRLVKVAPFNLITKVINTLRMKIYQYNGCGGATRRRIGWIKRGLNEKSWGGEAIIARKRRRSRMMIVLTRDVIDRKRLIIFEWKVLQGQTHFKITPRTKVIFHLLCKTRKKTPWASASMLAFLKSAFTPLVLTVEGMIEMEDDKLGWWWWLKKKSGYKGVVVKTARRPKESLLGTAILPLLLPFDQLKPLLYGFCHPAMYIV